MGWELYTGTNYVMLLLPLELFLVDLWYPFKAHPRYTNLCYVLVYTCLPSLIGSVVDRYDN